MWSEDLRIEYNFENFQNKGTILTEQERMKFISKVLKHRNKRKILVEPLVAAYLHFKWQNMKIFFYGHLLLIFFLLVIPLTLMTSIMVDMNSCKIGSKSVF